MKTRKFDLEWQLYKTMLKKRLPAKTTEEMETKMGVAYGIFSYFQGKRSAELAYNVINWAEGLAIAIPRDGRREIVEESIELMKKAFERRESKQEKEPDESFTCEGILKFLEEGYRDSDLYTTLIGTRFDFDLLFDNLDQNLDMGLKWAKGNYIHQGLWNYLTCIMDYVEENDLTVPTKVTRKYNQLLEKAEAIMDDPDAKVTHKFLY